MTSPLLAHLLSANVYSHVVLTEKEADRMGEVSIFVLTPRHLITDQALLSECTGSVVKLVTLDSCYVRFD